jgi:hypothetical protein
VLEAALGQTVIYPFRFLQGPGGCVVKIDRLMKSNPRRQWLEINRELHGRLDLQPGVDESLRIDKPQPIKVVKDLSGGCNGGIIELQVQAA